MRITITALFLCSCSIVFTARAEPEAEVIHWWAEGGDAAAVSILVETYESSGGRWLDAVESDFQGAREQVVSRLARGYPPTAMQWNAGLETTQFQQLGFLNTLEEIGLDTSSMNFIPDQVRAVLKSGDQLVGAPVNIHGENWMWSNAAAFEKINAEVPKSWEELLALAPRLEEAGITPIAQSTQDWQLRILFNSVLLGTAGQEIYYRIYRDADVTALESPEFKEALRVFRALIPYAREAASGPSWNDQVANVTNGESAMFFMGDWAKGEFKNRGAKLGEDFDCSLAPGNENTYLFLSDVFIFGRVTDPEEIAVQKRLAETMLDREFQIAFNRVKGSIPVRNDIDSSELDQCGQIATRLMNTENAPVPFQGTYGDGQFSGAIQATIKSIWSNPDDSPADAIGLLTEVLSVEKGRRAKTATAITTN